MTPNEGKDADNSNSRKTFIILVFFLLVLWILLYIFFFSLSFSSPSFVVVNFIGTKKPN